MRFQTYDPRGYYPHVISSYGGVDIHGYGYIPYLTVVRPPLLPPNTRLLLSLEIPLFEPFMGVLGSEFLQHTLTVNP